MAKDKIEDTILKNLKGFIKKGAASTSPGNIPTGHFDLDFAIHHGDLPGDTNLAELEGYDSSKELGIPLGKVVEFFGEEGGGKSSLAYRVIGYAQKMGHYVAWIDTEHSFADNLAELNGVDRDSVLYANMSNKDNPDKIYHAEDVFDNIVEMIKSGVGVIVLDSVANLLPREQMEKNADEVSVAKLARIMSTQLGKIVAYADKYGALVIMINQLRIDVMKRYGDKETTPGGRSLKHNSSLRIKISKKSSKDAEIIIINDKGEEDVIGRKSNIRIVKNRFAKPCTKTLQIPIYYQAYFPDIEDVLFDAGRQLKVISVRKGVFKWKTEERTHEADGRENFIKHMKYNEIVYDLAVSIREKAKEDDTLLPPEITKWMADYEMDNAEQIAKKIAGEIDEIVKDKNQEDITDAKSTKKKKATRGRKRKSSEPVTEDTVV